MLIKSVHNRNYLVELIQDDKTFYKRENNLYEVVWFLNGKCKGQVGYFDLQNALFTFDEVLIKLEDNDHEIKARR
jgi:hypothetical protein